MRLLKVSSLELTEFWDNEIPAYAILSHTWEKEEVSFNDMQTGNAKDKAGYAKILGCCRQALLDGHDYMWIDTCCIDKSSSAELTEAINFMYRWYEKAQICYAYLSDIESVDQIKAFAQSRWFTRGWTLQELIAPLHLKFYSKYWDFIGSKSDLTHPLSEITGISTSMLKGYGSPEGFSIAARMSWASRRVTTRVEDMAYCLMGIFRINMPLLYGEGRKAFIRLQHEIVKISNDHSLFAWTLPSSILYASIFADSPRCFSGSQNIVGIRGSERSIPSIITSRGLQIELVLISESCYPYRYIALLNCADKDRANCPIGIMVNKAPSMDSSEFWRREFQSIYTVSETNFCSDGLSLPSKVVYIREHNNLFKPNIGPPIYRYDSPMLQSSSFVCHDVHPFHMWTPYH